MIVLKIISILILILMLLIYTLDQIIKVNDKYGYSHILSKILKTSISIYIHLLSLLPILVATMALVDFIKF